MASDEVQRIAIDAGETTAKAIAHREYADQLEQHAFSQASALADKAQLLGDVFIPLKEKLHQELLPAMVQAYARVANLAREDASRLEATLQSFNETDAASAASINSVVE
jgi:hypothetical protein